MKYQSTRNAYLNCEKRIFDGVGEFDFPSMKPCSVNVKDTEVIGFNYAKGEKHPEDKIVHFYLDDYQFMRVWREPDKYIPLLKRFKAVMAPDFSMYTDFPKAVQIFNHYRKMWCAAYWQERGVEVIPTVCWSDESSFDWCFEGIPKHSLVCISTVGGFGNHSEHDKKMWLAGYEACLKALEPDHILLFGKHFPEIRSYGIMTVVDNNQLKRKKTLSTRPDRGNFSYLEASELIRIGE